MRYAFSILMFALSLGLFLAALVTRRDPKAIPRNYASKMDNPKGYAKAFAKVLAVLALAPLLLGFVGLAVDPEGKAVLFILLSVSAFAAAILFASRIWKKGQ